MKIYIVVQETQSEHGFVDTNVVEAHVDQQLAERAIIELQDTELEAGARVSGREEEWTTDDVSDAEWTVCYRLETTELYRAPITSVESQVYIDTGELPALVEATRTDTLAPEAVVKRTIETRVARLAAAERS